MHQLPPEQLTPFVFSDPAGKRWPRLRLILLVAGVLFFLGTVLFVQTLFVAPQMRIPFSLRPECIRLVGPGTPGADADVSTTCFRGRIKNQTFGGAMDMLEIDCGNLQLLRARIPAPGPLSGEWEFEFTASDVVRLRDGSED